MKPKYTLTLFTRHAKDTFLDVWVWLGLIGVILSALLMLTVKCLLIFVCMCFHE